jgi:hypothetical protein
MSNLSAPSKANYVQLSQTALEEQSDSDDELIANPDITPPFSTAEWARITTAFKELHCLYQAAVKYSFHNAHGKYFMEQFMRVCSMLDDNTYLYIRHGTSPSGDNQPGSRHIVI